MNNELIFLIGARASGKTSVGRRIAAGLGYDFVDLDARAVELAGSSIAELVEREGWESFRDLESRVLAEAAEGRFLAAATGGGAVLRPGNRELLRRGLTIYLRADAGVLSARLARNPLPGQRPPLSDKSAEEEMAAVLAERADLYMECADFVVDASRPLREVLAAVEVILKQAGVVKRER